MVKEPEQLIRAAFPEVPVPPSEMLVSLDEGDAAERRSIATDLGDRPWGQLSSRILRFHHDALGFLSPTGLRYLLPAFMLVSLESESVISDAVVDALTKPDDPEEARHFEQVMSPFNPAQREAIIAYLASVSNRQDWPDDAPLVALSRYWDL